MLKNLGRKLRERFSKYIHPKDFELLKEKKLNGGDKNVS